MFLDVTKVNSAKQIRVTRFKLIKSGKTGFGVQHLTLDFSKVVKE